MKSPLEVARWLAARFQEDHIPYAFGGALALAAWSAPRQTVDVDVGVFLGDGDLPRIIDTLERAGAMVDRADAAARVANAGLFMAQLGTTRIDVFLATHRLHGQMERRRRHVEIDGTLVYFLSPEDVALLKLFYARPKDVVDLERLFAAQPDMDLDYVKAWLRSIVPAGDRRLELLADLTRRFASPQ